MRILLVEDHPQLAESVVQALKGAGWTVDLLQDGVAADLALASEEYALAILDVGLPRMDGFEVLARLRAQVFGLDEEASADAIEIYVHRLRKKLEGGAVRIVTFRGLGYLLEAQGD
ncbi:response regulator [Pseudomonas aeruginosa]|uniref:response regulator n=1 Tax=Pseudomonas aeruginosa TaxID=287 RepID=UPI00104F2BB2|nr:response regulator [Pseudomonas aeruginosa]